MKKWIAAAAMMAAVPMASSKVLINIDAGAGMNLNSLGDGSNIADTFLLDKDTAEVGKYGLNMDANMGFYGWASIGLPLLPDVKLKYENMVLSGTNNVNINQTVFGETFNLSGDVESELDLSHLDFALTIGIPLPVVDIDFGINARSFLGGLSATGQVGGQTETVKAPFEVGGTPLIVPMGYLHVGGTIPFAGIKLDGEISTLPIGDSNFTDWNVKGTWFAPLPTNMLVKFGVEAGYRSFNMTIAEETLWIDTSDFASEVKVSGFFLGATASF